nr:hypothetical protein CPGR_00052 [Mycolicibacterium malmesburyense]
MLARPAAIVDRRFLDFAVDIADVRLRRCTNWSVRVESLSEQRATGVSIDTCEIAATSASGGNGGVGLANTDGVRLGKVTLEHSQAVTSFVAVNIGQLTVDDLKLDISLPKARDDAPPCARIANTGGVINSMAVRWPSAPEQWRPVLLKPRAACDPVSPQPVINTLTVEPSFLADRAITC